MTEFAFDKLRFNRASFPEQLSDLTTWPSVDISALSQSDAVVFASRRQAIELYIGEPLLSMRTIKSKTGVDPKTVCRLIDRCLTKHDDGRIFGFRAAIPYARLKDYERVHSINRAHGAQGVGLSGVFGLLLQQYPALEEHLLKEAKLRHKPITGAHEVRRSIKRIHKRFLEECRALGIKPNEYPLNQELGGQRSLSEYFRRYDNRTFGAAVKSKGAGRVRPAAPENMEQAPPATRAFEVVEFDGHKIDLRVTLRITDPLGFEHLLELTRIWILVVLDIASRAVIGYKLALSKEYNKDDVASAFQAALIPFRPRSYKIPGLAIRKEGGYPSAVFPQTQHACWEWLRFDGAKSHLAMDTLARLTQIVGCWPDNGPAYEPDERPFIERFFGVIAANFAHRLPGTTGSDPNSIERALSDPKGDLSLLVELDELEDMIEVAIGDYNGHAHDGISGRTPLEAMGQLLTRNQGFLRTLPAVVRQNLCLLQEARVVTIVGNSKTSVRPHINFLDARYTSNVLSCSPGLVGTKIRIYFDVRDMRTVKAFFQDGAELGVLTAAAPWCYTPHSLRVRREITRLRRLGKLKYKDGDDAVEAWEKYKWSLAKKDKRAATDLAKAQTENRQLPPKLPAPAPVTPNVPAPTAPINNAAAPTEQDGNAGTAPAQPPQPRVLRIKRTITF
jgi:putative transposase